MYFHIESHVCMNEFDTVRCLSLLNRIGSDIV